MTKKQKTKVDPALLKNNGKKKLFNVSYILKLKLFIWVVCSHKYIYLESVAFLRQELLIK